VQVRFSPEPWHVTPQVTSALAGMNGAAMVNAAKRARVSFMVDSQCWCCRRARRTALHAVTGRSRFRPALLHTYYFCRSEDFDEPCTQDETQNVTHGSRGIIARVLPGRSLS
jgi:hypothetical protein